MKLYKLLIRNVVRVIAVELSSLRLELLDNRWCVNLMRLINQYIIELFLYHFLNRIINADVHPGVPLELSPDRCVSAFNFICVNNSVVSGAQQPMLNLHLVEQ